MTSSRVLGGNGADKGFPVCIIPMSSIPLMFTISTGVVRASNVTEISRATPDNSASILYLKKSRLCEINLLFQFGIDTSHRQQLLRDKHEITGD